MEQFIKQQCTDGQAEFIGEEIFPGYVKVTGISFGSLKLHQTRPELAILKVDAATSFAVEQEPDDPIDAEPEPAWLLDDRAEYQQRAEMYEIGMGG